MIRHTEHLDKITESPLEYQSSTTVLQWIITLGCFYSSWPQNHGCKNFLKERSVVFEGEEFNQKMLDFMSFKLLSFSVTPFLLSRSWSLLFRYLPFYFEMVPSCVAPPPVWFPSPVLGCLTPPAPHPLVSVSVLSLCSLLSCQCYSSVSPFVLMVCSSLFVSLVLNDLYFGFLATLSHSAFIQWSVSTLLL